jgi:hypothetical protein
VVNEKGISFGFDCSITLKVFLVWHQSLMGVNKTTCPSSQTYQPMQLRSRQEFARRMLMTIIDGIDLSTSHFRIRCLFGGGSFTII